MNSIKRPKGVKFISFGLLMSQNLFVLRIIHGSQLDILCF
jgi:hypothetical protein